MKPRLAILAIIVVLFHSMRPAEDFSAIRADFVSRVRAFNPPSLWLGYKDNLRLIATKDTVEKETAFFSAVQQRLSKINASSLPAGDRQDYDIMQYQCALNLERLRLEQNQPVINDEGLYNLPNGKAWYEYFLKKWIGDEVTPQQIFDFGLTQIKRAQDSITSIRTRLNMDEKSFYEFLNSKQFFVTSEAAIADSFAQMKNIIGKNLHKLFFTYKIPDVGISRGRITALVKTPGYYNHDTFYYNLFDNPYCTRQFGWLFIHEAVPGHHLQISTERNIKMSDVQRLFNYSGYAEGWAAYTEEYGRELGAYRNVFDEMGKWEWDIVRSVRLPLDVGINYFGWTNEQALEFWKKNVHNQDDIAMREIERVRRWPCQVVCYKYGAAKFMEWRDRLKNKLGSKFDIRQYHDLILSSAGLPFFLIEKRVNNFRP